MKQNISKLSTKYRRAYKDLHKFRKKQTAYSMLILDNFSKGNDGGNYI